MGCGQNLFGISNYNRLYTRQCLSFFEIFIKMLLHNFSHSSLQIFPCPPFSLSNFCLFSWIVIVRHTHIYMCEHININCWICLLLKNFEVCSLIVLKTQRCVTDLQSSFCLVTLGLCAQLNKAPPASLLHSPWKLPSYFLVPHLKAIISIRVFG